MLGFLSSAVLMVMIFAPIWGFISLTIDLTINGWYELIEWVEIEYEKSRKLK